MAAQGTPGGKFTVALRTHVTPGEVNTLPLSPAGTPAGSAGVIFFRVYAPSHGNPWGVPVPHVTFTRNGVTTQLPTCPAKAIMIPANTAELATVGATLPTAGKPTVVPPTTASTARKPTAPSASGVIEPFAGHKEAGPGHTPDVNQAYLFGGALPTNNGDVVVIRGKAPTTPGAPRRAHGRHQGRTCGTGRCASTTSQRTSLSSSTIYPMGRSTSGAATTAR